MKKLFVIILIFIASLWGLFKFVSYQIQMSGVESHAVAIKCVPIYEHPFRTVTFQVEDMSKPSIVLVTLERLDGVDRFRANINSEGYFADRDGKILRYICNHAYGVPIGIKIQTCDLSNRVYAGNFGEAIFVPNPLEVSDSAGHCMSIKTLNTEGTEFFIELAGFQPNEVLRFNSKSCHECIHNTFPIDENGKAIMRYSPAVIG